MLQLVLLHFCLLLEALLMLGLALLHLVLLSYLVAHARAMRLLVLLSVRAWAGVDT